MRRPLSQHHVGVRCAAGELDDHLLRQADDALAGAGDAAGVDAVLPRTVAVDNADAAAVHLNLQMIVAVDGDGFCSRQAGEADGLDQGAPVGDGDGLGGAGAVAVEAQSRHDGQSRHQRCHHAVPEGGAELRGGWIRIHSRCPPWE